MAYVEYVSEYLIKLLYLPLISLKYHKIIYLQNYSFNEFCVLSLFLVDSPP